MNCPHCQQELPIYILRTDFSDAGFCPFCHKQLVHGDLPTEVCPLVQDGEMSPEDYDPDNCVDCVCDICVFGKSMLDDFGMTQDEEGNWCYPGDE